MLIKKGAIVGKMWEIFESLKKKIPWKPKKKKKKKKKKNRHWKGNCDDKKESAKHYKKEKREKSNIN